MVSITILKSFFLLYHLSLTPKLVSAWIDITKAQDIGYLMGNISRDDGEIEKAEKIVVST